MKGFKKWSRFISLVLVCVLMVLAGCTSKQAPSASSAPNAAGSSAVSPAVSSPAAPATADKITIKIATANAESDVKTVAARKMKEELEKRSNGKITVEVYPAGQLLSDTGMVEGIPKGTADIGICGLGWWSGKVPEVTILGAMGIFDSENHYWTTCENGLFDYLAKKFETNASTRVLAWMYCGSSEVILTRNRQVTKPDDMKGLKFRVPNNSMGSAVKAMGASPVTIPVADVYTSLQTGVIDGTWGMLGNIDSNNFWDVVGYVTALPLAYSDAFGIIVSNNTWSKWPKDVQDLVSQVSVEMYKFSRTYIAETNGKIWDKVKAKPKLKVYFVPESDVTAFAKLTAPGQLEIFKSTVKDQSYQDILNLIDKNRKK